MIAFVAGVLVGVVPSAGVAWWSLRRAEAARLAMVRDRIALRLEVRTAIRDVWRAQELIAQPALMAGRSMGDWPRAIGRLERIRDTLQ